jgi:hypothetical protein
VPAGRAIVSRKAKRETDPAGLVSGGSEGLVQQVTLLGWRRRVGKGENGES